MKDRLRMKGLLRKLCFLAAESLSFLSGFVGNSADSAAVAAKLHRTGRLSEPSGEFRTVHIGSQGGGCRGITCLQQVSERMKGYSNI